MNNFLNYNDSMSITPKHKMILETLEEWGVKNIGTTYMDAVLKLEEYLHINRSESDFTVKFGEFGVVTTSYNIISDTEIEEARKFLSSKKKLFGGPKIYVRNFFCTDIGEKNKYTISEPGLVFWEISGLTFEEVNEINHVISNIIATPTEIHRKNHV